METFPFIQEEISKSPRRRLCLTHPALPGSAPKAAVLGQLPCHHQSSLIPHLQPTRQCRTPAHALPAPEMAGGEEDILLACKATGSERWL